MWAKDHYPGGVQDPGGHSARHGPDAGACGDDHPIAVRHRWDTEGLQVRDPGRPGKDQARDGRHPDYRQGKDRHDCQGIQGHFGYGPSYQSFRDNKEGHAPLGLATPCGQCHCGGRARNLPIFAEMKKSRVYLKEILSAPKVLPGVFSHKRNPIDIMANGRKIAEATGGEYVFNPKQVSTMKRLVKKNDKTGLHSYVRSLIQKFEKP